MPRRRGYGGGYGSGYYAPNVDAEDPLAAALGGALGGFTEVQAMKARRRDEADRKREREQDRAERQQDREARERERWRSHTESMNKNRREAAEQGFQYRTLEEVLPVPGVFPGMKLPPGLVSDYVKVRPSQRETEISLEHTLKAREAEEKRKAEEAKALNDLRADARFLGIQGVEQMDAATLRNVIAQKRDEQKRTQSWEDFERRERFQHGLILDRNRASRDARDTSDDTPKFLTPGGIATRAAELTEPTRDPVSGRRGFRRQRSGRAAGGRVPVRTPATHRRARGSEQPLPRRPGQALHGAL
jgi:hypothetical protein